MQIDVQYATDDPNMPTPDRLRGWATLVLEDLNQDVQLTIRVVSEPEGRQLNSHWRKSTVATNVLSFAYHDETGVAENVLGDIVICAAVVIREAMLQGKDVFAHWAHMVIHGVLHLNKFDHEYSADAAQMEDLEIKYLKAFNYPNPYLS